MNDIYDVDMGPIPTLKQVIMFVGKVCIGATLFAVVLLYFILLVTAFFSLAEWIAA